MVAKIEHLKFTKSKQKSADNNYQLALNAYWGGELNKALDKVTQFIDETAENSANGATLAAYRLWIEVLAQQEAKNSLRQLARHLLVRAQAEPQAYNSLFALRGLAHFEADEFAAAKLLGRCLEGVDNIYKNTYAVELIQSIASRSENTKFIWQSCLSPVADYIQWQSITRTLLRLKQEKAMSAALEYISENYRASTLPQFYEYHRCVDAKFYAGAALVAQRLCEMYPQHPDYDYYLAYALFEDGNYPRAKKTLQAAVDKRGETDAEAVGLLGHCHAKMGEPEKAAHYLKRAISMLQAEGLPTSHIQLELATVEEEMRGDELDPAVQMPRQTRMWLINLSARRYNDLLTSSTNSIERLLRPMGDAPRSGDFCFFAGPSAPDKNGEQQWKIAAIYVVDSDPIWHPVHNYHTALQLVARPPEGIPVAVQRVDEGEQFNNTTKLSKHHPFNYGIYELEIGALDIITEAVKKRSEELYGAHQDNINRLKRHG